MHFRVEPYGGFAERFGGNGTHGVIAQFGGIGIDAIGGWLGKIPKADGVGLGKWHGGSLVGRINAFSDAGPTHGPSGSEATFGQAADAEISFQWIEPHALGRGLGDPSAIDPKLNLGFSDNEPDRVLTTICNHPFRV